MPQGTMLQYFHWYMPHDGSLWKQIKEEAPRLKEIGFTSIWFPPAYKGSNGAYSEGYNPYDLYDLGEFDQKGSVRTKYGTREEYFAAIDAVHENGMQVIVDIVLNHKSGGDECERIKVRKVDPEHRNKFISEEMEIDAFTKFTFPGRNKKYTDFEWNYMCFTGVDYASDTGEKAIFKILNEYGDSWQEMLSDEKGNFDYLMYNDVEFRNPAVKQHLIDWGKWYWFERNFDGVRLDAVKHIPASFYKEWLEKLREHTGQEIFTVGEYWTPHSLDLLLKYIEETNHGMSLFDCCLQNNFHDASVSGRKYDMRKIFDNTLLKARPEKAVTIVDNHDTQPLQSLEAPVESWFKALAYSLILLRLEGYPCIFYADIYGAHYKDTGEDGKEYEIWLEKVEELEMLMKARRENAHGNTRDYFDHKNCVGWIREGDEHHSGCAVLMSNGDDGYKDMEMGKRYAGKTFIDLLQKRKDEVKINKDGWGKFLCNAGSVSVWVEK
ncbi:MAG: alpha-amylase [Ginsengibacter sp.]